MAQNDLELRIRISADGRAAIEGINQVERQVDHLGNLASKVGPLIAGYLSFEFLKGAVTQLFNAGAALQDFQTRFSSLAGSAQAAAAEMDYVRQTAQKLGLGLNEARESYAQLLAQQQAGVITLQQSRDLLEGFGRAAQMTGAGSEQVKQAMLGLSQALSSGTVSTEDFRQAVDPLPGMMKRFADAMNTSIGQLKKDLADGKVSSADFAQAMIQGLQEAGKGAEDFSASLSATWQRVKNEWTLLLEAFGKADFLSLIEDSSFNGAMAWLLSTLEQTLKDASAFIRSGWLSDAFSAELTYIQAFLADTGDAVGALFTDIAQRAKTGWAAFTAPVRPQLDALQDNFFRVFTDLPEYVAGFTVIAAATLDGWVADVRVAWAIVEASFVIGWENMKGFLADVLNSMIASVASAVNSMGQLLGGFLTGAAEKLRALPDFMHMDGVADAFQAGAERITQASAGLVDAANQRRDAALAETQTVIAGENAKLQAVQESAAQTQAAAAQTAQDMALEFNARTQARDAAIEKAQADRQAGSASAALTPITQTNTAATAANAAAKDKAAKAAADHAKKIAEELQALAQDTAGLQKLTAAYLTFNDALVTQVKIENELEKLDPALRDAARAKAIEELNNQAAQRLYDLERENQLSVQESIAILTSTQALDEFLVKKELEAILRERNTGALDKETAQIVQQKLAAGQLARAADEVMDAYRASQTPLEKYHDEMERIAKIEAQLKGQAGAWTEAAQQGVAQLRKEAEETRLAADPMAKAFQQAAEGIYNAWSGMWESIFTGGVNSFKDFAEQIKTLFMKMLAQLVAAALARPILLPVIRFMGGAMGLQQSVVAGVANNLFGAGALSPVAGAATGGGILSSLGSGFGLWGGGGIGSLVGGAMTGLGGLFGGTTFGAGLTGGGYLMGANGLLTGGYSALSSGIGALGSGATGVGMGLISSVAIPVVGAILGGLWASGVFDGPTPHPSSFAIAGSWPSGYGDYSGYQGKGDWVTGASGMGYGYAYGHTDPNEAKKLRDAFLEMDAAMAQLVPGIDLANAHLGGFGNTAEGFIAGFDDSRFASMDEVSTEFVKAWVGAAEATGAVSETVSQIVQTLDVSAEELIGVFGALQQLQDSGGIPEQIADSLLAMIDRFGLGAQDIVNVVAVFQQMDAAGLLSQTFADLAMSIHGGAEQLMGALQGFMVIGQYLNADLLGDFSARLEAATRTVFEALAQNAEDLQATLAETDWTDASQIQAVAGMVQDRYALEIQLLDQITGYLNGLTENFSGSIESIQLSVMDTTQKYDYWSQKATEAAAALESETDPAKIAQWAEDYRTAAMNTWNLLDETQKQQFAGEFVAALAEIEAFATEQLNVAQQAVVDAHEATVTLIADTLEEAGTAAAQAIEAAAQAMEAAGSAAADAISGAAGAISGAVEAANTLQATFAAAGGMAAGGIVGGAWNGQSGIAGDTVATLLTPGEAVIPREQTQKHRALLDAVMNDQVRYAALGQLPGTDDLYGPRNPVVPGTPGAASRIGGYAPGFAQSVTQNSASEGAYWQAVRADSAAAGDAGKNLEELTKMMKEVSQEIERMGWDDLEIALARVTDQMETTLTRAAELGANEAQLAQIRELAALKTTEIFEKMLAQIDELGQRLTEGFMGSIESMRLSIMDPAEKYAYYTEIAEAAFAALKDSTDPQEIEKLAEEVRQATMSAWGTLDETQRKGMIHGFEQFLVDVSDAVNTQLVVARDAVSRQSVAEQTQVVELAAQVAQQVGSAVHQAGSAVSAWFAELEGRRQQADAQISDQLKALWSQQQTSMSRMAAGGVVGGTWNGKNGIAGDTVATLLTPGEAVIPREQTQKHQGLIQSIMNDQVRYAALGQLPTAQPRTAPTYGQLPGWIPSTNPSGSGSSEIDAAARNAEQLAGLMQRLTRELRDLGLSDFEKQLVALTDTLADTSEQITDLGGGMTEIAVATEIAAKKEQKLRETRAEQLADFLQQYEDAALMATGVDALAISLMDVERRISDAVKKATALGASEEQLTLIRAEGQRQADDLAAQQQAALTAFLEPYRDANAGLTEFSQSLVDLDRAFAEGIARATALGAGETELQEIRLAQQAQWDAALQKAGDERARILQGYSDAALSDFARSLRDLQDSAAQAIARLTELNASAEELAAVTASAALQEQKLRDERQAQLDALMAGFSTDPLSELEQQLAAITQQAEEGARQAMELGASQQQLAQIEVWAAQEAEKIQAAERERLAAQREQLDQLLQPFQDHLDQLSAFEASLRDLSRQTEEAIQQATELGATTADLAVITASAVQQEQKLRDERQAQLDALMEGFNTDPLSELERQLAAITKQAADGAQQAAELGASQQQLAQIEAWATQETEKLTAQQREQLDRLLQPYADLTAQASAFDASLRDLSRQTEAAIQQATDLGATAADLAVIAAGAAIQEQKLRDERQAQLDALMEGFSTDRLSDFEQQLAAVTKQAADGAQQAAELGASQQQLAQIEAWATQETEKLTAQQREQLDRLLQPFQDHLDQLSAFDASLRDLSRETETAIQQATELGATTADLAIITASAALQEQKLRDERQAQLDALMEGFSLEPLSDFEQQLAAVTKQAEEGARQAAELGASQQQLAQIDAWATQETKRLYAEREQALADFMSGFDTAPTAAFTKALYDLGRQLTANLQQATALGASEAQLAQIRNWTSEQAVQIAEQATQQEIATFEQAAAAVAQTLENLTNGLRQLQDGIAAQLLDFDRLQPDWNEVAYQQGRVTQLQNQLTGEGLPLEQRISLAEQLRAAVMNRYQAEMTAQQALQQEQTQATTEQAAALERMVQVAKNLRAYLDGLKLSDLSILSPEQKLAEARQQYQSTVTQARGGDAEAQANLQQTAQTYLGEARSYYASNPQYAGIFDQVTTTLDTLATAWQHQGESGLAAIDATLSPYEEQSLALADAAAGDLQAILPLLSDWQAEAIATATTETDRLRETLNSNTTALIEAVTAGGLILADRLEAATTALHETLRAAVQAQADQLDAAQANRIAPTAHATGGVAYGWSLVGEQGPELVNFQAPARVYPARETRQMLETDSGEQTEAVVLELKALVRLQAAANQQLISKLEAVESRLAGIESKARLEAAA